MKSTIIRGDFSVVAMYHANGDFETYPAAVTIKVTFSAGPPVQFTASPNDLKREIQKIGNRLFITRKACDDCLARLMNVIDGALDNDTIPRGLYFERSGIHVLEGGRVIYVCGDRVIGPCPYPYHIASNISQHHVITGDVTAFRELLTHLSSAKSVVRFAFYYSLMVLLRSSIPRSAYPVQGVLYIRGSAGLGKTLLSSTICNAIVSMDSGVSELVYEGSSTPSALVDAMTTHENLPVLVDDICKSANQQTLRKRLNTGAEILRQTTSTMPITKRLSSRESVKRYCVAGFIITAELDIESISELERCIFLPIDAPLEMPPELTSELFGTGMVAFLSWVVGHYEEVMAYMNRGERLKFSGDVSQRVSTNLSALHMVGQLFVQAANEFEPDVAPHCALDIKDAINQSLATQYIAQKKARGEEVERNLAFVLNKAFQTPEVHFDMTDKRKKAERHEGVLLKGDIFLRKEPLESFVCQQEGFENWSINRISRELVRYDALVLHKDGTNQIKIIDNVRGYRIRLNILAKKAQSGAILNSPVLL